MEYNEKKDYKIMETYKLKQEKLEENLEQGELERIINNIPHSC